MPKKRRSGPDQAPLIDAVARLGIDRFGPIKFEAALKPGSPGLCEMAREGRIDKR